MAPRCKVCTIVLIGLWNLFSAPSSVKGEPIVFTKLLRNSEQNYLEFSCHVRSSPSAQVIVTHYMDTEPVTDGEVDVTTPGPGSAIHTRVVHIWNDSTEFTCSINHPFLPFESSSTRSYNPGSWEGNEVAMSPNYVILLEPTQEKSSVSFQCDAEFYFDEAVTWTLRPGGSVLDDELSGLNASLMSIEIVTGLSRSVITLRMIDLPSDVYHISCGTRPRGGSLLTAEARLEIAPSNRLDVYNILVPFLVAFGGLFFVAFHVLGGYVVISRKLRKRSDRTTRATRDDEDDEARAESVSSRNHALAPAVPLKVVGSSAESEGTGGAGQADLSAHDEREKVVSALYYYSNSLDEETIPHPRKPKSGGVLGNGILTPRDGVEGEGEDHGHEYENPDHFQKRRQMAPTAATFGR